MNTRRRFDVLIVYSASEASSSSATASSCVAPFSLLGANGSCNTAYGYFLETCKRQGLRAAFTTSRDIIAAGTCNTYWTYENKMWIKNSETAYATQIFDKCAPSDNFNEEKRNLLFSSKLVKPYNPPALYKTLFDKQATFTKLSKYMIPTVSIVSGAPDQIKRNWDKLRRLVHVHPNKKDFGTDIILKDRFGSGGNNVYKIPASLEEIVGVIQANPKISFIMQPFIRFDRGFTYQNRAAATDMRCVYLGDKIVQTYIRRAKDKDFRCNEHQGGTSAYLKPSELPRQVIMKSKEIARALGQNTCLYSLDFVVSNRGNAYFLEGNTGPGLNWDIDVPREAVEPKKLIRLVVQELSSRLNHSSTKRIGKIQSKLPLPAYIPHTTVIIN